MNLETGVYFSFNLAATKIWEEILAESVPDLAIIKFAGPHNTKFFEFLLEQKLVISVPMTEPALREITAALSENEVAEWETFSDMQDLLLIDPVHDVALNDQGWPQRRKD